jgi:hypothetical protein
MLALLLAAALAQDAPPLVAANEVELLNTAQPPYPRSLRGLGVAPKCQTTLTFDLDGQVTDVVVGGCADPFLGAARDAMFQWKAAPLQRYGQPSPFRLRVVVEFLDPNGAGNAQGSLPTVPVDQLVWSKKKAVPPIPGAAAGTCTVDAILDQGGKMRLITVSGCSTEAAEVVESTLQKWRAVPVESNGTRVAFRTRFAVQITER